MAMPDPTLGRVQDTGHAGIRQGLQSIMDSLNQNSQMAMSAIENWKQRDYAAKEAEKERVFKADEALKTRVHDAEQKGLDRASSEKIAADNNKTSIKTANIHSATQKAISASKHNQELSFNSAVAGRDLRATYKDEKGKIHYITNPDGSNQYGYDTLRPNTPQQPTNPTQRH